jgi:C-terminal processing protease CtpA/Prc
MSGLKFAAAGSGFRTITVEHVDERSAGALAGMEAGDQIEAIDNVSAEGLSIEAIKRLMSQDGSTHLMRLRRGTELIQVSIVLHRVI